MKYFERVICTHKGCLESARYTYDTRKELMEAKQRRLKYPWKCTRHSKPEEVLSMENLERSTTLSIDEQHPSGKYWNGRWGFIHGDGYKAFANDFPVGTKIIVTAKVILPPDSAV